MPGSGFQVPGKTFRLVRCFALQKITRAPGTWNLALRPQMTMHKVTTILVIFLSLLISAAACAGPTTAATGFPAVESGSPGGLYPVSDLSAIGATGKHQFINIYANW